jgi:hypothetical protein
MADGGAVWVESRVGGCPPVVGGGQEVGEGCRRARTVREEERKWGKGGGGAVAAATVLIRWAEVGDSRLGDAT